MPSCVRTTFRCGVMRNQNVWVYLCKDTPTVLFRLWPDDLQGDGPYVYTNEILKEAKFVDQFVFVKQGADMEFLALAIYYFIREQTYANNDASLGRVKTSYDLRLSEQLETALKKVCIRVVQSGSPLKAPLRRVGREGVIAFLTQPKTLLHEHEEQATTSQANTSAINSETASQSKPGMSTVRKAA